ncbi:MAG: AI-2E family transporter, partial [Actinomycetota bacterium]|nr:AI-2E family transporter [Actinomycetota bacterium]
AVAATLTIVVLTILMLLSGPRMLTSGLGALSPPSREHVRHVASDCARAVSGYVAGNLLISLIAGFSTLVFLFFAGVPFRTVLALWVGFADLIPLVGATLGAIPAILVAFLHSTPAGIATIIFFVVYQQFENHVLQVTIMAKTVSLNPLVVLVSVLIGVELAGLLGALLAIPVAGVIQVIGRDLYDQRRGRFKDEPTIGTDEVPVSELVERGRAASEGTADDARGEAGEAEPEADDVPAEEKELVPAAVAPGAPAPPPVAAVATVMTGPGEEPSAASPARGPVDAAPGQDDWPVVASSAGDSTDRPTAGADPEPDRQAPE